MLKKIKKLPVYLNGVQSVLFLCLFILILQNRMFGQTAYDVTPGTKGNEITLSLANISEILNAENISVSVIYNNQHIVFKQNDQALDKINPNSEKEAVFSFDIKRDIPVNKKDTVSFLIKSSNGILASKDIILNVIAPKEYKLEQNFPNPFNPTTKIQYQIPVDSKVTIKIYDILGEEVTTLVNKEQEAGYKEVSFNGLNYASGVYIYRLTAQTSSNTFTSAKKMMMVK
jgi:membrane-bound inhibitor of C-type lysozyme